MAGWRETNTLKPIDSVTEKGDGELSGRSESERTGGPEMTSPEGRTLTERVKAHMGTRKLTDTGISASAGWERRHDRKDTPCNWRSPRRPGREIAGAR